MQVNEEIPFEVWVYEHPQYGLSVSLTKPEGKYQFIARYLSEGYAAEIYSD